MPAFAQKRGPGRPKKHLEKEDLGSANIESSNTFITIKDEDAGTEEVEGEFDTPSMSKRGRGRPRKYPRPEGETPPPPKPKIKTKEDNLNEEDEEDFELKKSTSVSKRGGRSLRQRETLKTTKRYSPPIKEVSKRGRRPTGPMHFPSTSTSSSRYIAFDSDEDMVSGFGGTPRKKKSDASHGTRSYLVDVQKDAENNKMVIMLPDGTTYKVDAVPPSGEVKKGFKRGGSKRPLDEEYEEYFEEEGDDNDPNDEDFRPGPQRRSNRDNEDGYLSRSIPMATGIKIPKPVRHRAAMNSSNSGKVIITGKSVVSSDGRTTKITTPSSAAGRSKVTFITTPKSVTVTATNTSFKQPPKRNYGSTAKFIDELPDITECTNDENDPMMSKIQDKILMLSSDLPLRHALVSENEKTPYLFRQVISPVMSGFPCLLCITSKMYFKEEKDLIAHYSGQHELETDNDSVKFSEDIVFVCLPKSVIAQMNEMSCSSVVLNAPCQYCGDEAKLATVEDMKAHYNEHHGKAVEIIEQEEILSMHKSLYCYSCSGEYSDFGNLHKHLKEAHHMQTFVCKRCQFMTQDGTRLKTHYKAKHMVGNRMQNLQCSYCNGLVIGAERMNKHIMSSHCVQTGVNEYSCTSCLQPCGKADEILAHSYRCPKINSVNGVSGKEKNEGKEVVDVGSGGENMRTECFMCHMVFDSMEKCNIHLNHVHTKWLSRSVLHDTFLMVRHPSGKTDIMPKPQSDGNDSSVLKLADVPSENLVEELGIKSTYGYYCFKCDAVIKIYQLYYLHMYNVHKLGKMFECKVTSCKQTFKEGKGLEEHIKVTSHPQMSVIENPLSAITCHYCDSYFKDEGELHEHHLSDEHFNKINLLMDKSGNKPEPRNHKCKGCHTWFGLSDSFYYHMETESHKHACPYCGLHFALPSSRRTHIQSHHSEKMDVCEICHAKQGYKERLFAHLVEHNIVFECNKCMRKFYQKEQLNAHMETHGEPIQCNWDNCSKRIPRSALSSHIRNHRIENESKCQTCGKAFSSRQLLAIHMEVHAKAENNAKAILSSAGGIGGNNSQTIVLKETPPAGTTLISITTPSNLSTTVKPRTPGSRTGSRGRGSRSLGRMLGSSTLQGGPTGAAATSGPTGLKMICCSCNQLFSTHNELSTHKCVVPVLTITGSGADGSGMEKQEHIYLTTGEVGALRTKDETTSDNLEEDPEKLVLDLAAQLMQTVQAEEAEKLKQKQLQKVEQLISQQAGTVSKMVSTPSNRGNRTYSNLKSQSKEGEVGKVNENPIQEIRTHGDPDSQHLLTFQDQKFDIGAGQEQEMENKSSSGANEAASGEQCIVIQQPDGQLVQLCVPSGMDLEEVVRSLNFSWTGEGGTDAPAEGSTESSITGETLQVSEQKTDMKMMQQQEERQEEGQEQKEEQQQQTVEVKQEGMGFVAGDGDGSVGEGKGQDSDQQVIYLPVNEDGTCAIDANALAMLTGGNPDVPIIVTSTG